MYSLSGTITPGGTVMWQANNTTLNFTVPTGYSGYTKINDGLTPSKYVAFDTKNCGDSCISGTVTFQTDKTPGRMDSNTRVTSGINSISNIVGWSASDKPEGNANNGQISWEHLVILGFGYGLYQEALGSVDMNSVTDVAKILPYTRGNIGILHIERCLIAFETGNPNTGNSSNGFDDMSINILRCNRCGSVNAHDITEVSSAVIGNTDLHVNSFFFEGLEHGDTSGVKDAEDSTITCTINNNMATLNLPNTTIFAKDIIVITGAGLNSKTSTPGSIYYVSKILAVGGTDSKTLTLEPPLPEASVSGGIIYINPPSLKLSSAKLTSQHFYVEEIFDRAVELEDDSAFVCSDFKISGGASGAGTFAARTSYPIISTRLNCSVDINLHPKALNNYWVKGVVGFGKLKNSATPPIVQASIMSKITAQNRFADWVNSYLFGCIQIPASLRGSYLSVPIGNFISNLMPALIAQMGNIIFMIEMEVMFLKTKLRVE